MGIEDFLKWFSISVLVISIHLDFDVLLQVNISGGGGTLASSNHQDLIIDEGDLRLCQ